MFTAKRKVSSAIDVTCFFDAVATSSTRCLLDSCSKGRFTVAAWDPLLTIELRNGQTSLDKGTHVAIEDLVLGSDHTFFDVMDAALATLANNMLLPNGADELPFLDALFGFIGYETAWQIEQLPEVEPSPSPESSLFLPGRLIIVDNLSSVTYVVARDVSESAADRAVDELIDEVRTHSAASYTKNDDVVDVTVYSSEDLLSDWDSDWSKDEYLLKVERVREYISQGDIFQANLSQGFHAPFYGQPYAFYRMLREVNPAMYAAFIQSDNLTICSVSPELFLEWADGYVVTKPIKGTQPRGASPSQDEMNREYLGKSEKDRAELVMIVDVERNDFHRFCDTGTVRVPELFALEAHPTVWHQYATVEGRFDPEIVTPGQILKCVFPGGSITGAPKIRSMEVIHELEGDRRGVYTGAIGYVSPRGHAAWNIPIRTMTIAENQIAFRVGGGITWYSDAQLEYDETLAKGRGMMLAYSLWKQRTGAGVPT